MTAAPRERSKRLFMAATPEKLRHRLCQEPTSRSGLPVRVTPKPDASALSSNAHAKRVPDLIGRGLELLFCGINPSLCSAAVGHHFARPGNRFWKAIHGAGFTPRLLRPEQERDLLELGIGITNIVSRATASAAELSRDDYRRGAIALARKLRRHRPRIVAFLGIDAYRIATGERRARIGPQPIPFAAARAWLLPNPSGLNAHYQLDALIREYSVLARQVADGSVRTPEGARPDPLVATHAIAWK
jgi:double-stranded uracil-DNA glycosylase